jgi:hypothetical protein
MSLEESEIKTLVRNTQGLYVAYAINEKISHEIVGLIPEIDEDYQEWFGQIDGVIQLTNKIKEGFEILRATALALVEDHWDDLPLDLRKEYNYQFRIYAEKCVPDLNWKTIDNHIRAARTFVLKDIKPSHLVPVIRRSPDKTPLLERGEVVTDYVEFDPLHTPISKLVLIRSAAESGKWEENPELIQKVVDSGYTLQDVRLELFSDRSKKAQITPEMKFELLGPVLVVNRAGDDAVLVDDSGFNWGAFYDKENRCHDLVYDALNRIFSAVGLIVDEDIIAAYMAKRESFKLERENRRLK